MDALQIYIDQYKSDGSTLVGETLIPLSSAQWDQLEDLSRQVEFQKVVGGDTGDRHSVWVGRFVNDIEKPVLLSPLSEAVLSILMSDTMQQWYRQFLPEPKLCIRRCQANLMKTGDFIGYHVDQDTTPDYKMTAVFMLGGDFMGGQFVIHPFTGQKFSVPATRHSVIINRGDLPHEVLPVESGQRLTLACFLSTNFGDTQRPRLHIKTV